MKSPEQIHIEKCHALATEWFRDHVATKFSFTEPVFKSTITVLDFHRPGTGNYAMTFIITARSVVVSGDVGDAIYAFTGEINLAKLATFDWHYFVHKCVASETGRNYEQKVPGIKHMVPNIRAIAHWVGLQMAIKQTSGQPINL